MTEQIKHNDIFINASGSMAVKGELYKLIAGDKNDRNSMARLGNGKLRAKAKEFADGSDSINWKTPNALAHYIGVKTGIISKGGWSVNINHPAIKKTSEPKKKLSDVKVGDKLIKLTFNRELRVYEESEVTVTHIGSVYVYCGHSKYSKATGIKHCATTPTPPKLTINGLKGIEAENKADAKLLADDIRGKLDRLSLAVLKRINELTN